MNNSNRHTSKDTLFKSDIEKAQKQTKHRTVQKTASSKHNNTVNRTMARKVTRGVQFMKGLLHPPVAKANQARTQNMMTEFEHKGEIVSTMRYM